MFQPPTFEKVPQRVLDFDIETLAAGYADPSWVPDKVTAVAWSWVGSTDISCRCDPLGFFSRGRRRKVLFPLLDAIDEADIVTGHNIVRFDLRVLSAECMRLGLSMPQKIKVIDTIQLPKSKGFKKGQDDLSVAFGIPLKKKSLNWTEWDDAYEGFGPWPVVEERVMGDVRQHKALAVALEREGLLKEARVWKP